MASPAYAGTDSGSIACGTVPTASARGEQQRLDTMTIKVNGATQWNSSVAYVKTVYTSYKGTRTWSVASDSILLSGSYGFCLPLGG